MILLHSMGGEIAESDVGNQVHARVYRQPCIAPGGKHPSVTPGHVSLAVRCVEDLRPVPCGVAVAEQVHEPAAVSQLGPLRHAVIVLTPGASPACPAPNMQIAREVIAVLSPR